ncbi:MAG TPA: hypothetical protein VFZ21_00225, partial [Gemmatimonadaceae bacterium]|nr:hypothetical protein [Gemmatimonadaceae bacterium]
MPTLRLALALLALAATSGAAQRLDVVLVNGRVLDPETGTDGVRTVGIANGRITVVAPASEIPAARDTVDVRGLVVAPGFIDLHSHGQ